MSANDNRTVSETLGTNGSIKEKSFVGMVSGSSPLDPSKLNKKSAFSCETDGKTCTNTSRIPRPPLAASNSFNEGRTKKPQSMIPRSRSRKRKETVKFDIPSDTESLKNQLNMSIDNKFNGDQKSCKSLDVEMNKHISKECLGEKLIKVPSLKSCKDLIAKGDSDTPKEMSFCFDSTTKKEEEPSEPPKSVKPAEDKENELEAIRQERTIRCLYETIKCTVPLFDNIKRISRENTGNGETERLFPANSTVDKVINNYETVPDFSTIQGHYEFTLNEISNIWKNTISLIGSVRDHAVKFVEGNNTKIVDREQLSLEAEMLQLALDFAISYSKLKTDFLIKLVRKRLNVSKLQKTELEKFMDSKAFSALYSNDDLAAMARTVQDLNASLLKTEDQELE